MTTTNDAALLHESNRFKWITAVGEHGDDLLQTLVTRNHEVIRDWASRRGAEPATGRGKVNVVDGGTGLRFDFPGMGRFVPISWDEWFTEFEEFGLVFVFRETREDGQITYEYRIVPHTQISAA